PALHPEPHPSTAGQRPGNRRTRCSPERGESPGFQPRSRRPDHPPDQHVRPTQDHAPPTNTAQQAPQNQREQAKKPRQSSAATPPRKPGQPTTRHSDAEKPAEQREQQQSTAATDAQVRN